MPSAPATAPSAAGPGLRRAREGRVVAGVAAGLARRFAVPPVAVRVAFVLAALVGGAGVVAYLALWALLARDGDPARPARTRLAGAIVVVALGVGFLLLVRRGPRVAPGLVLVVLAVSATMALVDSGRARHALGWILRAGLRTLLALVALALVALLAAGPLAGIGLHGGVGARQWRPVTLGRRAAVGLLAGSLVVDLRHSALPQRLDLTASVDVGHLVVELPAGDRLVLDATTGLGRVIAPAPPARPVAAGAPTVVVHAGVGIGLIQVRR